MTNPTPKAVEAVAEVIERSVYSHVAEVDGLDGALVAHDALTFIRDAIHRDGPDADAIRDALGLRLDEGWSVFTHRPTGRVRVVGEWQEVQP